MDEKVYMTKNGYEKLRLELNRLKKEDRPKIIQAIIEARAHGDLSENAEYHAAKESQGFIETRIMSIEDKLARADIIDTKNLPKDKVVFGVTVVLTDSKNKEIKYNIVGTEETDIENGKISIASPMARALIGHKIGDEISVKLPSGTREYQIKDILFDS